MRLRFACAILAFLKDEFKTTSDDDEAARINFNTRLCACGGAAHYNEIKSLKVQARALRLVYAFD